MSTPLIRAEYDESKHKLLLLGPSLPYSIGTIRVDATKDHHIWFPRTGGDIDRYQIIPDTVVNLSDLVPALCVFLNVSGVADIVQGVELDQHEALGAARVTVTLTNETDNILQQIEISDSPLFLTVGRLRLSFDEPC